MIQYMTYEECLKKINEHPDFKVIRLRLFQADENRFELVLYLLGSDFHLLGDPMHCYHIYEGTWEEEFDIREIQKSYANRLRYLLKGKGYKISSKCM